MASTPVSVIRRRSLRLHQTDGQYESISAHDNATTNGLLETPNMSTPNNMVYNLRQRLEKQMSEKAVDSRLRSVDRTSPGLSKLRMTPGRKLQEKQEILVRKHEEARNCSKSTSVGGGVSIWPQMDNMRLTRRDFCFLLVAVTLTFISVLSTFVFLHGPLMQSLTNFHLRLKQFRFINYIDVVSGPQRFNSSLLDWHSSFTSFMEEIQSKVNTKLSKTSFFYQVYIWSYVLGIGTLLYYIADNVYAKNRLTPRRIKIWVCLLVAMGTWTILMLQLLVLAQSVESAIEANVHQLGALLADLVYTELDLTKYRDILSYWHSRCLPPTTEGTLTVLNIVAVRDISYYLQYYSLPIITALLTPVIKLLQALTDIYSVKPHA